MRKKSRRFIIEAVECRLLCTTIYVDNNPSIVDHDGAAWSSAYSDLQQGLAASVAGDVIRIADGIYSPTGTANRAISFQLKTGVTIEGSHAGFAAPDPDARDADAYSTRLSGDIGVIGTLSDNSYHVVDASGTDHTAVLDGVTVTFGNANGTGTSSVGGGIYNSSGSPTISNCVLEGNSSIEYGGGMFNTGTTAPILRNCTIVSNKAGKYGGGIYNENSSPILTSCTFSSNSALLSGGMFNYQSTVNLIECDFLQNSATVYDGGGMYNSNSTLTLIRSTLVNNSSKFSGGGMYNANSSLSLVNCKLVGNSGGWSGGGMQNDKSSLVLTDCVLDANVAASSGAGFGGGMANTQDSSLVLDGCVFLRNRGVYGAGLGLSGSNARIDNCSFLGNVAKNYGGGLYNNQSSPTVVNCLFVGNSVTGTSSSNGGAATYNDHSAPSFVNCTFGVNVARSGGAFFDRFASPSVSNCILWGNTATTGSQFNEVSSGVVVTYSIVQGGWAGTGNLSVDPQFKRNAAAGSDSAWGTTDDDYGDMQLKALSPAIDTGNDLAVPAGVSGDIIGNPRVWDGDSNGIARVDLGAFEYSLFIAFGGSYGFDLPAAAVGLRLTAELNTSGLSSGDMILRNRDTNQLIDNSSLNTSYDGTTRTTRWSFASPLPDGNYRATLPMNSLEDTSSRLLSADYTFDFFVLAADANHDRYVDVADFKILTANYGGANKTFATGDFDYDGDCDNADLATLSVNWNKYLAPPPPQAEPVVSPPPPSTTQVASSPSKKTRTITTIVV